MKEYKVIPTSFSWRKTEKNLNDYVKDGWIIVCSYAGGNWIILERDTK